MCRVSIVVVSSTVKHCKRFFFSIFFILQLHLNPIHAVVQLRPSLEHLKSDRSKRKNSVIGDANDFVKSEGSSEKKPVVLKKQVYLFLHCYIMKNYLDLQITYP